MVSKSTDFLIFVDSNLEQYQHLVEGVDSHAEVIVLDARRDGVQQITDALQRHHDIQALHILSHAAPGVLSLGSASVTTESIDRYALSIRRWSRALASNAEIFLYGCRLAAGVVGRSLVHRLADLTQAAIAASDTFTGASHLGGDWDLSIQTAPMTRIPVLSERAMQTYPAVMPLFDWSDPEIDWPEGELTTITFNDVDGTNVDFTISVLASTGAALQPIRDGLPGSIGNLTPDDVQSLQGGQTVVPTALHINMNNNSPDDTVTTRVSFSRAIGGVAFQIYDIDEFFEQQDWQDEVEIIGFRGNREVLPRLIATGDATYTIDGNVATGQGNSPNTGENSGRGTLSVVFTERITGYEVIYRGGPDSGANPQEQGIAILSNIFFNDPENDPPNTNNVRLDINPGESRRVVGLGGRDPDGTVEEFRIVSLPPARQGTVFLGNPNRNGRPLEVDDLIPENRINQVFFQASDDFTRANFDYASIDNEGAEDPTPGRVRLRPGEDPVDNQPPDTVNVTNRLDPDSTRRLRGLGGSDPDGTVERFQIVSLPRAGQGTLLLGNPNRNSTPVDEGQEIDASDIGRLFFQSTPRFAGTTFNYAAIDDQGAIDRRPGVVTLLPRGVTPPPNRPPQTTNFAVNFEPDTTDRLRGFAVTDPDGDDTVESFTILRLPRESLGTLFIGNPNRDVPVVAGAPIDIADINRIFFSSTEDFIVVEEEDRTIRLRYTATDDQGASDETPALGLISPVGASNPDRCRRGETLIGTRRGDRLTGTRDRDRILGRGGNDRLQGRRCPDVIDGNQGNDIISGDQADDILRGGAGNDQISGGSENDRIKGGIGSDRLNGDSGNDTIQGGQGNDRVNGGDGNDQLFGRSGDDLIIAGNGNDVGIGGRGADRIRGGRGNDRLEGGGRDDRLRGDPGNDRINGGIGNDIIAGRIGRDRINGALGDDRLDGGAGADTIRGDLGDDFLEGGAGADRLRGNQGDDRLRGGKGNDIANGGRDDDFLSGRNGADRLRLALGDDRARGNRGNDILIGNRGDDRLNAGGGDDMLIGGFGADVLVGGGGSNMYIYRSFKDGGDGGDRILRFDVDDDLISLESLFRRENRFSSNNPFRRYVSLSQDGDDTRLDINAAGDNGTDIRTLAIIRGIDVGDIGRSNFVV